VEIIPTRGPKPLDSQPASKLLMACGRGGVSGVDPDFLRYDRPHDDGPTEYPRSHLRRI